MPLCVGSGRGNAPRSELGARRGRGGDSGEHLASGRTLSPSMKRSASWAPRCCSGRITWRLPLGWP